MDKKNALSYTIITYGDVGCGKTAIFMPFNLIKNERRLTLSELAETLGTNSRKLSKLLYDLYLYITKFDIKIYIANNFICDKLKEYIHFRLKYKHNIVYYLIKIFDRLSECMKQNRFIKIRGDTLCFSF